MLGGLVVIHSMHIQHPHIMVNQRILRPGPSTILFRWPIMGIHIITPSMGVIMAAIIFTADTLDTVGGTLVIGGGDVSGIQEEREQNMGILDQRADNWFKVCEEFIVKEFGSRIQFRRTPDGSSLRTILGIADIPECKGGVPWYDVQQCKWGVVVDTDIQVNIHLDGSVSFGFWPPHLEDDPRCVMEFVVEHPREVSELFSLLILPAKHVPPEGECPYGERKLGELGEFRVLLPDGETWRIVDPSALPADTPDEFRKSLYSNLALDFRQIFSGAGCEVCHFAERWPDFMKSLPVVSPQACAGYILDAHGNTMTSAIDLAVIPPDGGETVFNVLMIPDAHAVSSLYLRQSITGDKELGQKIHKAFLTGGDLDAWITAIKAVPVRPPVEIRHQIRLAAEQNRIRKSLLKIADQVACQRDAYSTERNWHLAHTLSQILDTDI